MNREEISAMMDNISDRHIEEAMRWEQHNVPGFVIMCRKIAAVVAVSVLGTLGVGAIAFAANEDFRNAVIKLFSGFSEGEKQAVREGHMTGNMNAEDTLLEFLHQFQDEEHLLKQNDDGFEYTLTEVNNSDMKAIITCSDKEYLQVELKGTEVDGVMAWKVDSYQIISGAQVGKVSSTHKKIESSDDESWKEEDEKKAQESVIKTTEKQGKLYKASDKNNIVTLPEDETDELSDIFKKYNTDSDNAWFDHGSFEDDYEILLPEYNITVTKKGYVIKGSGADTIAFILEKDDLKTVLNVLEKYKF